MCWKSKKFEKCQVIALFVFHIILFETNTHVARFLKDSKSSNEIKIFYRFIFQ